METHYLDSWTTVPHDRPTLRQIPDPINTFMSLTMVAERSDHTTPTAHDTKQGGTTTYHSIDQQGQGMLIGVASIHKRETAQPRPSLQHSPAATSTWPQTMSHGVSNNTRRNESLHHPQSSRKLVSTLS